MTTPLHLHNLRPFIRLFRSWSGGGAWVRKVCGVVVLTTASAGGAQAALHAVPVAPTKPPATHAGVPAQAPTALSDWIERMHQAARERAYTGTFVVSNGTDMAASKIWHVCDGVVQMERIETLTGTPRTTLRRNDEVMTFLPDQKTVFKEQREALRVFPDFLRLSQLPIESVYGASQRDNERVAGFDTWVVDIQPRDTLRYPLRMWIEMDSGLVLKMQTRNNDGTVLEQVAFTELELNAAVSIESLGEQMRNTRGYRVVQPQLRKTTPEQQGWKLAQTVPGFQSMSTHMRTYASQPEAIMQWVFSDGLTSVSLFAEPHDPKRHSQEHSVADGAMHSLGRRHGAYWVTVMGEVPPATLALFAQSLQRTR